MNYTNHLYITIDESIAHSIDNVASSIMFFNFVIIFTVWLNMSIHCDKK